ncbi:glycosyltransferase family 2 protein [Carboxylicivirga sediminis]|uniref:Glycosyltransferase family 2 protein n=1 Tax=Carboxylicivirga sediminis TaxID=2006564 RepID=A0A941IXS6_9BACT|nr:glycosyltransferase family 2 protein [Carboxylicivirga sediminis]MBR8535739.1 glycosyltransferase family 2 protein [Carboxylicivirga sediminis]
MNNATVSIVIPIYNVAPYLSRCFKSCINQSYTNIELIAVNDGSTDDSLNLINSYASKDYRIKIVDKPNGGLNSAREAGIKASSGKYITIVDGDDYLETDAIEKLLNIIEIENADIVVAGANIILADNNQLINTIQHPELVLYNEDYTKRILSHGPNTVCMKLYKTELIKEATKYPNIKAGQDLPVSIQWSLLTKKVVFTQELIYNYVVARKGSTMSGDRKIYVEAGFQAFYYTFEILANHISLKKFEKELTICTCSKLYTYMFHQDNDIEKNKSKITEMGNFVLKKRKYLSNKKQYRIFIWLLLCNHQIAHTFVAFMQKIKPTLNPYTK